MEKFKIVVDDKGKMDVYMDGHSVKGLVNVEFNWNTKGDMPTHKLEFLSFASSVKGTENHAI